MVYGGLLNTDMRDAENFTVRLFELARSYALLSHAVSGEGFRPILNIPPWPGHAGYGPDEVRLFGRIADLHRGREPDLPWTLDELFPPVAEGWRFAATSPRQRYAWAVGLTAMRELVGRDTRARVVAGGTLSRFQGLVLGVVEECWLSIRDGRPLHFAGAFGGCARAVVDQLRGREREEFSEERARSTVPDYADAVALYPDNGRSFTSMAAIGRGLADRGASGLAAALINGLDESENEALVAVTDARWIAELVLKGLSRLGAKNPG